MANVLGTCIYQHTLLFFSFRLLTKSNVLGLGDYEKVRIRNDPTTPDFFSHSSCPKVETVPKGEGTLWLIFVKKKYQQRWW